MPLFIIILIIIKGSDKAGGLGGKGDEKLPKLVERLNDCNISSLSCGPQFTAAYSDGMFKMIIFILNQSLHLCDF